MQDIDVCLLGVDSDRTIVRVNLGGDSFVFRVVYLHACSSALETMIRFHLRAARKSVYLPTTTADKLHGCVAKNAKPSFDFVKRTAKRYETRVYGFLRRLPPIERCSAATVSQKDDEKSCRILGRFVSLKVGPKVAQRGCSEIAKLITKAFIATGRFHHWQEAVT